MSKLAEQLGQLAGSIKMAALPAAAPAAVQPDTSALGRTKGITPGVLGKVPNGPRHHGWLGNAARSSASNSASISGVDVVTPPGKSATKGMHHALNLLNAANGMVAPGGNQMAPLRGMAVQLDALSNAGR